MSLLSSILSSTNLLQVIIRNIILPYLLSTQIDRNHHLRKLSHKYYVFQFNGIISLYDDELKTEKQIGAGYYRIVPNSNLTYENKSIFVYPILNKLILYYNNDFLVVGDGVIYVKNGVVYFWNASTKIETEIYNRRGIDTTIILYSLTSKSILIKYVSYGYGCMYEYKIVEITTDNLSKIIVKDLLPLKNENIYPEAMMNNNNIIYMQPEGNLYTVKGYNINDSKIVKIKEDVTEVFVYDEKLATLEKNNLIFLSNGNTKKIHNDDYYHNTDYMVYFKGLIITMLDENISIIYNDVFYYTTKKPESLRYDKNYVYFVYDKYTEIYDLSSLYLLMDK